MNASICNVEFPYLYIYPIENKDNTYLAMPLHSGVLIKNPFDKIHWNVNVVEEVMADRDTHDKRGLYPGDYNAQFFALYGKEGKNAYALRLYMSI